MSDEPPYDPAEDAPTVDSGTHPGRLTRIGRYTIRRVIASGGMGTVLEAIQDEPRRVVAIKIMKGGVGTPEALHRFQFEAQLLARLRHPAIAQIYEAGTHDDGSGPLPFFAMEYIPNARTITDYVQSKRLGVRERLALFAQVCDAVHHGHQKGIVHRDLKPGNILVDSAGAPHVIDFGVARASDSDSALPDYQTEVGQLVGSVAYMSPEQFDADPHDLDMRTDVYSLGLVLFEMLSGELPYDIRRVKLHEAARLVRDSEPQKLRSVNAAVPAEVETIVGKALAKDRDQRYQSAFGLGEDIRRFLKGDPISAVPPSAAYQFKAFARRQKPLLAGVAAVFLILVVGVTVSSSMYLRAEKQRAEAVRESARAQAAIGFLTESLESLETFGYDEEPSLKLLMDEMSRKIDGAFKEDPVVESDLRRAIAWGYMHKFDWPVMQEHLGKAIDLRKVAGDDASDKMLELYGEFQFVCSAKGDNSLIVDSQREVLRMQEAQYGPEDPHTLTAAFDLADALSSASQLAESWAIAADIHQRRLALLGAEHKDTMKSSAQLAWLTLARGEYAEAEQMNQELFAACRRNLGEDDDLTREVRSQLGAALLTQGKIDAAASLYGNRRMPADLSIQRKYQGSPDLGGDNELLVFWETWCPFSQRTVPALEGVHLRFPYLSVIGLTSARVPSSDAEVMSFIDDKNLTFPVARVNRDPWRYFDVKGTPWVVIGHEGIIIWEDDMNAPDDLLENMLRGLESAAS